MIDEITIRNKRTGEEIVMDKTGNTGFIISEIDWDTAKVTNESYRIPFQVGETLSSTVVGTRVPTITGYVVSLQVPELGTTWEDYYNGVRQNIEYSKNILNRFISIYDYYEIIAGNYYLTGKPTQPVKYFYDENENNEVLCLFELEFGCYDPMFRKVGGSIETFYKIDNMFHFPMHPTNENPIVFGLQNIVTSKAIINNGDVPTGLKATIRPKNDNIEGFILINSTNGQKLVVNEPMNLDDYIFFNTLLGEEDIYIYKSEEEETISLVGDISIESAFIQLERGENDISYEITGQSEGLLEIDLEYFDGYFNIKEI